MAWERRGKQLFYYRSIKVGRTVRKIYYGKGREAELAALAVEQRQQERTKRAAARRQLREDLDQVGGLFDRLEIELDNLTNAELVASGCEDRNHRNNFKPLLQ